MADGRRPQIQRIYPINSICKIFRLIQSNLKMSEVLVNPQNRIWSKNSYARLVNRTN